MYPVGVLFGLGFDTATEVALLFLAAGAGMSLLDTIDGSFMNFAYGWALSQPVRKVYYNITITGLSVAVAFIIGSVELLGILAEKASLTGGFWDWIAGLDLNILGYGIVGLFVATWAIALAVWRYGRIEEKWTTTLRTTSPTIPASAD
jgi:high-affinity nickel-transport protein